MKKNNDIFKKIFEIVYPKKEKVIKYYKRKKPVFIPVFSKKQNFFWFFRFKIFVKEMLRNKVHIGHHRSVVNPEMYPHLLGFSNKFSIINLQHTLLQLQTVLKILYMAGYRNARIFLVGTNPILNDYISNFAEKFHFSYVGDPRWTGGILTNLKSVKKSVRIYSSDQKNSKARNTLYKGLSFYRYPSILLVLNPQDNFYAIREANKLRIPVVAFIDTDSSLKGIDYPIICNNTAIRTVFFLLQLCYWAYFSGVERIRNKLRLKEKLMKKKKVHKEKEKGKKKIM